MRVMPLKQTTTAFRAPVGTVAFTGNAPCSQPL